jgi:short-subunit dehydrogenase
MARTFAKAGYDVALTARRTDRLEALADEIRLRFGVETFVIAADLAQPEAADQILAELESHGRVVDALVNNAGYGLPGTYGSTAWQDQRDFLQVLLVAVCDMTHKVLPGMVERRFGRVINVASICKIIKRWTIGPMQRWGSEL